MALPRTDRQAMTPSKLLLCFLLGAMGASCGKPSQVTAENCCTDTKTSMTEKLSLPALREKCIRLHVVCEIRDYDICKFATASRESDYGKVWGEYDGWQSSCHGEDSLEHRAAELAHALDAPPNAKQWLGLPPAFSSRQP